MGILASKSTRLLVQGITGREGRFHAQRMREYGTQVVAGVTPGRGGAVVEGIPVFDTVESARESTGANASCIFVPPVAAADAMMESLHAGIDLVVCITEGIPTIDVLKVFDLGSRNDWPGRVIGPNGPGLVTVGEALIGITPASLFTPGPVGLVSRSGTLTYEVVNLLTESGLGQTTCVGIGGDPIIGTSFVDCLRLFEQDMYTRAIVLIGEIGGSDEEEAATFIGNMTKPVVAFISGRTAPPGKRMGHAGAIVSGRTGTAQSKIEALRAAGADVADSISEIPALLGRALGI